MATKLKMMFSSLPAVSIRPGTGQLGVSRSDKGNVLSSPQHVKGQEDSHPLSYALGCGFDDDSSSTSIQSTKHSRTKGQKESGPPTP